MSPGQVLGILWRRSWIAALTLISAIVVAGGVLLFVPGRYDAVATASIDPGRSDPISGAVGMSANLVGINQGNLISLVQSERVALAVVQRLNLAADPTMQNGFRRSEAFGRIPIENWIADQLLVSVAPTFPFGTNVLTIKYKSSSAIQSALIANGFMAATIDAAIEMKAASAEQKAQWFSPQIDALKAELAAARAALQDYQQSSSLLTPMANGDAESTQLLSVAQDLAADKNTLAAMQSRLDSPSVDLSTDPNDPDLQLLASLKNKAATIQSNIELLKSTLGANNPKVFSETADFKSSLAQIDEETKKMREHLRQRIDALKAQIKTLEGARTAALQGMIAVQGQRDKLAELQRDVQVSQEQLEAEEKAASQARLQSKLTFSDMAVLDKATPPAAPAFPKPFVVMAVAIGAGLSLGLILALLAEALDRRVRYGDDLELAVSAPVLGILINNRRSALVTAFRPARIGHG
jgi:uncharacterized protein involved in exopolysaccharide biosynthesis